MPSMIAAPIDEASGGHDQTSLRFATSAGEALPVSLYERWTEAFGITLNDGLGTAEMWHVLITNKPRQVPAEDARQGRLRRRGAR